MSLSGEDKFGKGSNNYTKYGATEHLGGEVTANSTSGRIGDLNLTGSAFIGGDTQGLKIGKVNVESAVNSYDLESKQTSKNTVSKSSTYIKSHQEENVAGNLQLSGARIEGNLTGIGSNITSLEKYEDPYDFMKDFDLATVTPKEWKNSWNLNL